MSSSLNGSLIGRLLHIMKTTGSLVYWSSQSLSYGAIQPFDNDHSGVHLALYSLIISSKITRTEIITQYSSDGKMYWPLDTSKWFAWFIPKFIFNLSTANAYRSYWKIRQSSCVLLSGCKFINSFAVKSLSRSCKKSEWLAQHK